MDAYYFGCWSPKLIGHYLYDANGSKAERSAEKLLPIKVTALDGGLLNGVPDVPGNAVLFQGRGWTLLSFWDRSGDHRPNSNSTFLLPGRLQFGLAVETAQAAFPQRWSLINFPLLDWQTKGGEPR